MFSFLHRSRQTLCSQTNATEPPRSLCFTPATIISGITFHLLDDRKVTAIDPQSQAFAAIALARRLDQLSIPADKWAAMENGQRLQWLLNQSHIVVKATTPNAVKLVVT
jgi:hypothetical protein